MGPLWSALWSKTRISVDLLDRLVGARNYSYGLTDESSKVQFHKGKSKRKYDPVRTMNEDS